ncbi:MAG: hypothetical protein O3A53_12015 [Acidobacteria bacterium]|nr:hypothetical protein [Acidobacteriota bacterium]
MSLEQEKKTYQEKLSELLKDRGKYALIHKDQIVEIFGTYEDAMKEGYEKFKLDEPFMVRQIVAAEQSQFVSRL